MNNLHRELAPISDSAWAQIEEETSRTLKRYLALPSAGPLKTIAAFRAYFNSLAPKQGGSSFIEMNKRIYDGLRKAGMPEE